MNTIKKQPPTIDLFKQEASAIKLSEDISHSESLNRAALLYGYKNYNAIKPFFKKACFPILPADIVGHLEKLTFSSAMKHGGVPDYFLRRGHSLYEAALKAFFEIHPHAKKEIRTSQELSNLENLIRPEFLLPLLAHSLFKKISSSEELRFVVEDHLGKKCVFDITSQCVALPGSMKKIKSIGKCNEYSFLWEDKGFHELERLYSSELQQLNYSRQSLSFLFSLLKNGSLDDSYYSALSTEAEKTSQLDDSEAKVYIEDFNSLHRTSFLHEDLDSFVDDVKRNKPIDKRIENLQFLQEDSLEVFFLKRIELIPAVKKALSPMNVESANNLGEFFSDLHSDVLKDQIEIN